MVQTIKNNWMLLLVGAVVALSGLAFSVSASAANISNSVDCGAKNLSLADATAAGCDLSAGVQSLNDTITLLINAFSVIVGLVAVVMLIYGGFRYVTSGGDSGNVGNAKNTIMYGIIGLVIVAVAQSIVQFVLTKTA